MEKKMTKRDYYEKLREITMQEENAQLTDFIDGQLMGLVKKAEKAKEKAIAKRNNEDELRKEVRSLLTNEYQTIEDITNKVTNIDATKAKVVARLTKLVKGNIVEKIDVKDEEGRKIKAYRLKDAE